MNILITLCLSFAIFALIIWGLMHMRTPRFRMERAQFQQGLEDVIAGQADDNEWRVLISYPMRHDPPLEQLRLACIKIEEEEYTGSPPYLFTDAGLQQLRDVRERLLALPPQNEAE
ncbi:hypothetical protein ACONUD_11135 [Microbulbifer harenosus]|uniref:Uncharacterized protein n=1 Tax=Microbulbifer harenosus TaxID=2576840 RepID=A0ABY2UIL0_9GAMM|nr:hypothetical protein [Microbulbifer harenosus]TLM76639.1 hypothetical protein FDY93_13010 [Microbulbifer harenosus]